MRHSFTLLIEYGKDLRESEKQFLKSEIEAMATKHGMYTFAYQDNDLERYAFFAIPSIVDLHKDYFEISSFKSVLENWLIQQAAIIRFDSGQFNQLSQMLPLGNSLLSKSTNSDFSNHRLRR